ncbi:MAG TPA: hypothetical protein PK400_08935 [Phycisphaerales bacterium]|nr:hypothetical protein [Phycisphaerales bacterium]
MANIAQAAFQDEPPKVPRLEDIPEQFRPRPAPSPPVLWLVAPLDRDEAEWYFDQLTLSDPQRQAARRLFESYRADYDAIAESDIVALTAQGAELAEARFHRSQNRIEDFLVPLTEKHTGDHHRLSTRVASLDAMFFAELALILAEEQIDRLPSLEATRKRTRYSAIFQHRRGDGVGFDLVKMVDALSLSTDHERAIQPILEEYVFVMAPLAEARYRERVNRDARNAKFEQQHPQPWGEETIMRRSRMVLQPLAHAEQRMRAVNVAFAERIIAELPQAAADQLRNQIDALLHPKYYPDRDAEKIWAQAARVLAIDSLQPDQRAAIESFLFDYRLKYDQIRRRLDTRVSEWDAKFEATLAMNVFEEQEHLKLVDAMLSERRELSTKTLRDIREVLTSEQIAEAKLEQANR